VGPDPMSVPLSVPISYAVPQPAMPFPGRLYNTGANRSDKPTGRNPGYALAPKPAMVPGTGADCLKPVHLRSLYRASAGSGVWRRSATHILPSPRRCRLNGNADSRSIPAKFRQCPSCEEGFSGRWGQRGGLGCLSGTASFTPDFFVHDEGV